MKVIIDTNSLMSLVRYYLPFDKNSELFDYFKGKIKDGEILIIDKVIEECTYISGGLIINTLSYLSDKTFLKLYNTPVKTDSIIAPSPAKFLRQLDNQFVNSSIRKLRNLSDVEYENQKNKFLNEADMRMILLGLNLLKENMEVTLVTEETEISNDNKLFKKIPAICKELGLKTLTLPELFSEFTDIQLHFK